jgi:hypothetical protein
MREIRKSGSVGAPGRKSRGHPAGRIFRDRDRSANTTTPRALSAHSLPALIFGGPSGRLATATGSRTKHDRILEDRIPIVSGSIRTRTRTRGAASKNQGPPSGHAAVPPRCQAISISDPKIQTISQRRVGSSIRIVSCAQVRRTSSRRMSFGRRSQATARSPLRRARGPHPDRNRSESATRERPADSPTWGLPSVRDWQVAPATVVAGSFAVTRSLTEETVLIRHRGYISYFRPQW